MYPYKPLPYQFPVMPGDIVYWADPVENKIEEDTVDAVTIYADNLCVVICNEIYDLNEGIFLTHKEAESWLEENWLVTPEEILDSVGWHFITEDYNSRSLAYKEEDVLLPDIDESSPIYVKTDGGLIVHAYIERYDNSIVFRKTSTSTPVKGVTAWAIVPKDYVYDGKFILNKMKVSRV